MFRLQQNLRKSNNFITLQQQNSLLARTVYSSLNLRFLPSAFYSTKKIDLPKINDEKVVTTLFTEYDKLDSFIGDRAYNYYATRALKLKVPGAIRKDFMIIFHRIVTREFLTEIAVKCELDKLMLQYTKNSYHLGEMMEAYCSVMIFNGMEEEMKKFTSEIVDYYFEKNKTNKVVQEVQNKTIEEMKKKNDDKNEEKKDKQKGMVEMKKKNDDKKDDKTTNKTTNEITNKVVKETNKEEKQQKGVEINKNDKDKNIKENKVNSENSKKKNKENKKKKGTNDKTIKEEKKKEIILSIKGQ